VMQPFTIVRPPDVREAVQMLAANHEAKVIAGGTNLVDLMKEHVERPRLLVDVTRLPLHDVKADADGRLTIGALVRNADLARHPAVLDHAPLLASALLAGASPQLRNMATTGGNLLQRTRCYYFYDVATPCNKRTPGAGCAAIDGVNRIHAIFGASAECVATHPSDMCVAMAALDAVVCIEGPAGARRIPFADFHRLPGDRPDRDTTLDRDEIVVAVEMPPSRVGQNHSYLKLRDRKSRRRWRSTRARSSRRGSRSAGWLTSPGATAMRSGC
jgi:xanthine dehydrogenase YagS FAD-binding subunit